jgi:hypothetical protein
VEQAILLTGLRPEEREAINQRVSQPESFVPTGVTQLNMDLPGLVALLTSVKAELYGEKHLDEPFTPLVAGAVTYHEIFLAFQQAGFTKPEALHLVGIVVQTGIMKGDG